MMKRTDEQTELLTKWEHFIERVPEMTVTEGDKYLHTFKKQLRRVFPATEANEIFIRWFEEYGRVTPSNPYRVLPF